MWPGEWNFIKTTYDISLDSQISLLPLGFSLLASSPLVTVFDWDARENPEVTRNLSGVPRNTLSLMVGSSERPGLRPTMRVRDKFLELPDF